MIQQNEIHTIIYSCQQGNKNKSITNIFKQQLERLKIIYTQCSDLATLFSLCQIQNIFLCLLLLSIKL
jgi:hypothetical protein